MRRVLLLIGLVVIGSHATAQPRPTPGITAFTSPDGVYTVTFPCKPSPVPVAGADPSIATTRMMGCDEGDFAASVVAHAFVLLPDAAAMDIQLRDQAIANVFGGKLTRDETVTRGEQKGRAVQVRGIENTLSTLTFILPESRHVYQVIAAMPHDRKADARVARFLDSFTFLKLPTAGPALSMRSLAFLQTVAAESNKTMPTQIDTSTELTNLSALEGVLIYNYRLVNLAIAEVNPARLTNVMRAGLVRGWCGQPQVRQFIDDGVTIRGTYHDKDRKPITSLDVTRADCP